MRDCGAGCLAILLSSLPEEKLEPIMDAPQLRPCLLIRHPYPRQHDRCRFLFIIIQIIKLKVNSERLKSTPHPLKSLKLEYPIQGMLHNFLILLTDQFLQRPLTKSIHQDL